MSNSLKSYNISKTAIRNASLKLKQNGISDRIKASYDGNINIKYSNGNHTINRSLNNTDIKKAYEKALSTYAERI